MLHVTLSKPINGQTYFDFPNYEGATTSEAITEFLTVELGVDASLFADYQYNEFSKSFIPKAVFGA